MKSHSRLTSLPPFLQMKLRLREAKRLLLPQLLRGRACIWNRVFGYPDQCSLQFTMLLLVSGSCDSCALYRACPQAPQTWHTEDRECPASCPVSFPRFRFSHHGHRDEWGHGSAPVRRAPVLAPTPAASVSLLSSWQALISVWLPSLCDLST